MSDRPDEVHQMLTKREHVLLRPDMYVGTTHAEVVDRLVVQDGRVGVQAVKVARAAVHLVSELLTNSADREHRKDGLRRIDVDVEADGTVRVRDDGGGIPTSLLADSPEEGLAIPTAVFGRFLAGSNFDQDNERQAGGRFGVGAKAVNVFSEEFKVETAHPGSRTLFRQTWRNNMETEEAPTTARFTRKRGYTEVTAKLDMARLGGAETVEGLRAAVEGMAWTLAGVTGPKVRVYFGGELVPIVHFEGLCKAFAPPETELAHVVLEGANGASLEVVAFEGATEGACPLAFVNGLLCTRGTHVDAAWKATAAAIEPLLGKGGGAKAKEAAKFFKRATLAGCMTVCVRAGVPAPTFASQTKEELTTPAKALGLKPPPPAFGRALERAGMVGAVRAGCEAAADSALAASGAKATKRKSTAVPRIPKYDPAPAAGRRGGPPCTLILTEGDSAKALAVAGLAAVGRERFGLMALRGKLLNARAATRAQIANNAELSNLAKILGLSYGTQYTSTAALHYQQIMIFADQDLDGAHIAGLILNWIHACFPSVLEADPCFVVRMVTPITRVRPPGGAPERVFFSEQAMEEWAEEVGADLRACAIRYYKGLGTSTSAEGREYFAALERHTATLRFGGEPCTLLLDAMFAKGNADARRALLETRYDPKAHVAYGGETGGEVTYGDFILKELLHFSMADNERSIPSAIDGLKPSQRKVLFTFLEKRITKDVKVAQAAGTVAGATAYHHGEVSLTEAIVGMAQDHVGANTLALLVPQGQFGSRLHARSVHAAPRYLHTRLHPVTRALFPVADEPILDRLVEDGVQVEPRFLLPVLPLALVNGAQGIGTGWSTSVPPFAPRELLAAVRGALRAPDVAAAYASSTAGLAPCYPRWTGTASPREDGRGFVLLGRWEEALGGRGVRVLDLPPGTPTEAWVEKVRSGGFKAVAPAGQVLDASTDARVDVTLEWADGAAPGDVASALGLATTVLTTNMHLFDGAGALRRFETIAEVCAEFHHTRLAAYAVRKAHAHEAAEAEAAALSAKARFVAAVVAGELVLASRPMADVCADLAAAEPPYPPGDDGGYAYLLNMRLASLTKERAEALRAEAATAAREAARLAAASPEDLWAEDLTTLERALDGYEADHAERYAATEPPPAATKKKARRKASAPAKKRKADPDAAPAAKRARAK
jgi:DNA topoisomerase-2